MKISMVARDRLKLLVDEAKRGSRTAFDELAREYEPRLVRLVESRLGALLRGKLEVQDVIQEALLRGFRSLHAFTWREEDSFFSWLAGIVEHVIRTEARKGARRGSLELQPDTPGSQSSPSQHLRREERFGRLQQALDGLSPEHREVIFLARIERLRISEIAARMYRTPDAIRQLLVRALRELRKSFGDTGSLHLPPWGLEGGAKHD